MNNRTEYKRARAEFDSYDSSVWGKDGFVLCVDGKKVHIDGFDKQSGGFVVYHKEHEFDPTKGRYGFPRGNYEKLASGVLTKYGMKVELGSENQGENQDKNKIPDGLLNGKIFDIKGVEGTGKDNILKDIKSTSKKNAEILVLYYHDKKLFNEMKIRESYKTYMRNSESKRIQQIYYIIDRKLYTLK